MLMANGYSSDAGPNRRRDLRAADSVEDEHSGSTAPSVDSSAASIGSPECGWGNHNGCSYIPRGSGIYRKHFTIPADWKGHVVSVRFEGVFRTATAYLNGQLVAPMHTCGYTPIELRLDNISGVVFGGGQNVLAVFVDGTRGSGHWYEGAGIWRHVRLIRTGPLSIDRHAVFAQQQSLALTKAGSGVGGSSDDEKQQQARVVLNVSVPLKHLSVATAAADGASTSPVGGEDVDKEQQSALADVTITARLLSPTSELVASATSDQLPYRASTVTLALSAKVGLWSTTQPALYTVVIELTTTAATAAASSISGSSSSVVLDAVNTTVGFRSANFTGEGFRLNDDVVKLRGFCDHPVFVGVGMAVPDRLKLFRAQALRSVGGNARRMSHAPATPEMLEIYDRLGIMVLDENRGDGPNGYPFGAVVNEDPSWTKNLGEMIRRDRNHASVILWVYCNEDGCDAVDNTTATLWQDTATRNDPTRPTAGNRNGNPTLNAHMSVQGFSHVGGDTLDTYHKQFPEKPTVASECCSCNAMRGQDTTVVWPQAPPNVPKISSFSGDCLKAEVGALELRPFVSGTFAWTLFDYWGESGGWPWVTSTYGAYDPAGFEKSTVYWYRAQWLAAVPEGTPGRPPVKVADGAVCHIVELWSSKPLESAEDTATAVTAGAERTVHVYTSAPSVALFLNGKSVGNTSVSRWGYGSLQVGFAAGNLTAICGTARHTRMTSGVPTSLALSIDVPSGHTGTGSSLFADGQDVALLRAAVVDANGVVSSIATNNVSFRVASGPGRVVAAHGGGARDQEPNDVPWHSAHHGLVRGIIRVTLHAAGSIAERRRLMEIDIDGGRRTTVLHGLGSQEEEEEQQQQLDGFALEDIVVEVTSEGLAPARVTIPVSNEGQHSVLETASRSVHVSI
jgi:hypothetical protein